MRFAVYDDISMSIYATGSTPEEAVRNATVKAPFAPAVSFRIAKISDWFADSIEAHGENSCRPNTFVIKDGYIVDAAWSYIVVRPVLKP